MSEWQCLPIRDLIDSQWPGEWGAEHNPYAPAVVVYRSTDIDDDGHLLEESGGVYRSLDSKKVAAKKLLPGDILLEASGGAPDRPVGRVAVFSGVRSELSICANFLRTLRPKKGVSSDFLRWVLLSLQRQSAIWRYQQQTTGIINLKVADYLNHKIETPPLPQQRRIAEILSTLDDAIVQTEALIAKHQQIKAGLMHDLFTRGVTPDGHLRPTREQAPDLYKESPLGWIPKEWEVRQVRELGDVITGNTPPEYLFSGDGRGIPFVTPGDVGNAIFVSETVRSVTPGLAGMARLITPNSTCVVCIGSTIGKLALVSRESITNQQINSVLCQKQELSFLAYFSMDYFLPSQLRREAGLQAVPIVKKSVFEKLLVAWPIASEEAMEVQNKLLGVAAQLEAEKAVACKLRQQKHGLMHDLLTGRVRVPQKEAEVTL